MKKKVFSVFMAITIMFGVLSCMDVKMPLINDVVGAASYSDEMSYGDLKYKKVDENNDGEYDFIAIIGCNKSVTEVNVPGKIDSLPVTDIWGSSFAECENLINITIPDSITCILFSASSLNIPFFKNQIGLIKYIGDWVYFGSYSKEDTNSMKNIELKEGTKGIASDAFYIRLSPHPVESIKLPNSLKYIGANAFGYCTKLKDITIPENVVEIGDYAFNTCVSLSSINVSENNPNYSSVDGILYNKAKTKFINIPMAINKCTIPDSITYIGEGAFEGCYNLTSISIPDSVTKIGQCAFQGCKKLTTVNIPNNFTQIQQLTFSSCESLSNISIPDSVTYISKWAFDNTAILNNQTGVKYVDKWVIDSDKDITTVTIPNHITNIGIDAFCSCANLKSITIENPNCKIVDVSTTICNDYYGKLSTGVYNGVIHGYENSTAQTYAEKYGYKFESIGQSPTEPPTNPVTTTTKVTTTKPVTTTKIVTTTNNTEAFVWYKDNWNFENSRDYFTQYNYFIKNSYFDTLRDNLTNTEWYYAQQWQQREWRGSCYGMSSLALLSKNGYLPYSDYTFNAQSLYNLKTPKQSADIESLINYYQLLQVKNCIQQQYRSVPYRTNEENIKDIISQLKNSSEVLVGFKKEGWGGHAIIAYDVSYGSWTKNNITYQGRIEILDPNYSMKYDENACIYFNTKTYSWAIPAYSRVNVKSTSGAVFNMVLSDVNTINNGGYLKGTNNTNTNNYLTSLEIAAVSENYDVNKVLKNENGIFMNQAAGEDDILPASFYFAGGESEGLTGYVLKDGKSGYKVHQNNAQNMDMKINYENCLIEASAAAGNDIIFDPSGFAGITGEATNYSFNMVYNEGYYPTDWYNLNVSGSNAENMNISKSDKGYIMEGNNLAGVIIKANNDNNRAAFRFNTKYKKVFIYEIDKNTIGIKVDTDNNGTFETEIPNEVLKGDFNLDGSLGIADVVKIQKYLVKKENDIFINADLNNDGKVNVFDAVKLKRILLNA